MYIATEKWLRPTLLRRHDRTGLEANAGTRCVLERFYGEGLVVVFNPVSRFQAGYVHRIADDVTSVSDAIMPENKLAFQYVSG